MASKYSISREASAFNTWGLYPLAMLLLASAGRAAAADTAAAGAAVGRWSTTGALYLSNVRLVFVAEKPDASGAAQPCSIWKVNIHALMHALQHQQLLPKSRAVMRKTVPALQHADCCLIGTAKMVRHAVAAVLSDSMLLDAHPATRRAKLARTSAVRPA
jgi:hypothetical protein